MGGCEDLEFLLVSAYGAVGVTGWFEEVFWIRVGVTGSEEFDGDRWS